MNKGFYRDGHPGRFPRLAGALVAESAYGKRIVYGYVHVDRFYAQSRLTGRSGTSLYVCLHLIRWQMFIVEIVVSWCTSSDNERSCF